MEQGHFFSSVGANIVISVLNEWLHITYTTFGLHKLWRDDETVKCM